MEYKDLRKIYVPYDLHQILKARDELKKRIQELNLYPEDRLIALLLALRDLAYDDDKIEVVRKFVNEAFKTGSPTQE